MNVLLTQGKTDAVIETKGVKHGVKVVDGTSRDADVEGIAFADFMSSEQPGEKEYTYRDLGDSGTGDGTKRKGKAKDGGGVGATVKDSKRTAEDSVEVTADGEAADAVSVPNNLKKNRDGGHMAEENAEKNEDRDRGDDSFVTSGLKKASRLAASVQTDNAMADGGMGIADIVTAPKSGADEVVPLRPDSANGLSDKARIVTRLEDMILKRDVDPELRTLAREFVSAVRVAVVTGKPHDIAETLRGIILQDGKLSGNVTKGTAKRLIEFVLDGVENLKDRRIVAKLGDIISSVEAKGIVDAKGDIALQSEGAAGTSEDMKVIGKGDNNNNGGGAGSDVVKETVGVDVVVAGSVGQIKTGGVTAQDKVDNKIHAGTRVGTLPTSAEAVNEMIDNAYAHSPKLATVTTTKDDGLNSRVVKGKKQDSLKGSLRTPGEIGRVAGHSKTTDSVAYKVTERAPDVTKGAPEKISGKVRPETDAGTTAKSRRAVNVAKRVTDVSGDAPVRESAKGLVTKGRVEARVEGKAADSPVAMKRTTRENPAIDAGVNGPAVVKVTGKDGMNVLEAARTVEGGEGNDGGSKSSKPDETAARVKGKEVNIDNRGGSAEKVLTRNAVVNETANATTGETGEHEAGTRIGIGSESGILGRSVKSNSGGVGVAVKERIVSKTVAAASADRKNTVTKSGKRPVIALGTPLESDRVRTGERDTIGNKVSSSVDVAGILEKENTVDDKLVKDAAVVKLAERVKDSRRSPSNIAKEVSGDASVRESRRVQSSDRSGDQSNELAIEGESVRELRVAKDGIRSEITGVDRDIRAELKITAAPDRGGSDTAGQRRNSGGLAQRNRPKSGGDIKSQSTEIGGQPVSERFQKLVNPEMSRSSATSENPPAIPRAQLGDMVVRGARQFQRGGNSEVQVNIRKPDMGNVKISFIENSRGKLEITITAERPEASEMLRQSGAEIRQLLLQDGIDLAKYSVSDTPGRQKRFSLHDQGSRRNRRKGGSGVGGQRNENVVGRVNEAEKQMVGVGAAAVNDQVNVFV